ncbi:hypothetical protein HDU67_008557 [Dinochytrium kinnereticum]|nr:hypothetical protein HDU67_008557 [Dinochytrium kinnereticum]
MQSTPCISLSDLPAELLDSICRFISPTDTVRLRSTGRRLRSRIEVTILLARMQLRNIHAPPRPSRDKGKTRVSGDALLGSPGLDSAKADDETMSQIHPHGTGSPASSAVSSPVMMMSTVSGTHAMESDALSDRDLSMAPSPILEAMAAMARNEESANVLDLDIEDEGGGVQEESVRDSTSSWASSSTTDEILRGMMSLRLQMEGMKKLVWLGLPDVYIFAAFLEFGITWDLLVSIYPKFDKSAIPVESHHRVERASTPGSTSTLTPLPNPSRLQFLCHSHLQMGVSEVRNSDLTIASCTKSTRRKSSSEPVKRSTSIGYDGGPTHLDENVTSSRSTRLGASGSDGKSSNKSLMRTFTLQEINSSLSLSAESNSRDNKKEERALNENNVPSLNERLEKRVSAVMTDYLAWRRRPATAVHRRYMISKNASCSPKETTTSAFGGCNSRHMAHVRMEGGASDDTNIALLWACRFGDVGLLAEILRLPKAPISAGTKKVDHLEGDALDYSERVGSANLAIALLAEDGHDHALAFLLERVKISESHSIPAHRSLAGDDLETTESMLQLNATGPGHDQARSSRGPVPDWDEESNQILMVDCSAFEHHALRMAAKNGHLQTLKTLTFVGKVDVGALGNYALRWAALNGHTEVVRFLVAQDSVDPSAPNDCAIRWASRNGHNEVVKILLDVGSEPQMVPTAEKDRNGNKDWPSKEQLDTMRRQRNVQCNPAADGNDALRWSAMEGHIEVVRSLLESGKVDPAAENNEALRWSCRNGHKAIAELLLSTGKVDADAEDHESLRWAARNGHADVVHLLLQHERAQIGHKLGGAMVDGMGPSVADMKQGTGRSDGGNAAFPVTDQSRGRMPKHTLSSLQMALQRGHMDVAKTILDCFDGAA